MPRFDSFADDQLLVEYASQFSEDAFTELFNRHQKQLKSYIRKQFRLDYGTVDDICQCAWLKVAEHCRKPIECFLSWIRSIACTEALLFLREKEPDHEQIIEDPCNSLPHEPLDGIIRQEEVSNVFAALKSIEPRHRVLIALRFIDGLTQASISALTGLPRTTVQGRLAIAIRSMNYQPQLAKKTPSAPLLIVKAKTRQLTVSRKHVLKRAG